MTRIVLLILSAIAAASAEGSSPSSMVQVKTNLVRKEESTTTSSQHTEAMTRVVLPMGIVPPSMVQDGSLATLTALSFVTSIIVILAPAVSILRIGMGQASLDEIHNLSVPYFFLFAQAYLSALYGVVSGNEFITHVNYFGAGMGALYLLCLSTFASSKDMEHDNQNTFSLASILGVSIFCVALLSAGLLLLSDVHWRGEVIAYTALCFQLGVFLSPFRALVEAVRTGSTQGFPLALSAASFISCGLWAQYSAVTRDWAYCIPNISGCLINGLQISVITWVRLSGGLGVGQNPDDSKDHRLLQEQRATASYGAATNTQAPSEGSTTAADGEEAGGLSDTGGIREDDVASEDKGSDYY